MNVQSSDDIRSAFASGEFAKARYLWAEYASQLQRMITEGAAPASALSEARELIDWSTVVVKVFRAHAADELQGLYLASMYQASMYQAGMYQRTTQKPPAAVQVNF